MYSNLVCQSCSLAMHKATLGTNEDSSENLDYCMYCYKNGDFTEDVTLQEMYHRTLKTMEDVFENDTEKDDFSLDLQNTLPALKRWKK